MYPNPPYGGRLNNYQFREHQIIDHRSGGITVSTFSHPADWRANSQVTWNMDDTGNPATVYAAAYNPRGSECFEFLPSQVFMWLEGDYGVVPVGQKSFGLVRMPPRPAPDALANLVIPAFRRDRQNLRVTSVQPVQNLWQLFNDEPPPNAESLMARVEYDAHGHAFEEEFYGVYGWKQTMQLNWGFSRLICFRAARGQLDGAREKFWRVAGSLRPTPQWKQHYEHVVQQLAAGFRAHIDGMYVRFGKEREQHNQMLAQSDEHMRQRNEALAASLEKERRQRDESARERDLYTVRDASGDALMGRTPYDDPNSPGVYHYEQGSPGYVWTDGLGNFHATDDPREDPNHHLNGDWVPARKIEPNR
jgi:hypothetical protein